MATYYVRKSGNDTNNGTAAGTAFLTIGKALSVVAAGDTVYVGAGTYRETVSLTTAGSSGNVISIIADVDGAQTGDAGDVIWSAYTTNDTSAPAASATINLNGKSFYTFQGFAIFGGNHTPSCVDGTTTTNSVSITLQDCVFYGYVNGAFSSTAATACISYTGLVDTASNWIIQRCTIWARCNSCVGVVLPTTSTAADYNSNFLVQDCVLFTAGSFGVVVASSGANTHKGGGVLVQGCYIDSATGSAIKVNDSGISTTTPCQVKGCICMVTSAAVMAANTSGQITEDYNVLWGNSLRTNVTAGTHSVTNYAPTVEIGHHHSYRRLIRPFGMPLSGSALLNFMPSGSQITADALDRGNRVRPSGGSGTSYAVGAWERHDYGGQGAAGDSDGGTGSCLLLTGPGDHDFRVPVDSSTTTISIKIKYDGSLGGNTYGTATGRPIVKIVNGGQVGVADQSITATTAANGSYETETSTIAPTGKGWVTLRVISQDSNGTGKMWADTSAIS